MRRTIPLLIAILLAGALFFFAGPATAGEAAECYPTEEGVYVCDARQRLPTFTTSGYAYGSVYFNTTYAWLADNAPLYTAPNGPVAEEGTVGILYYTIEETVDGWYRVGQDLWAKASDMYIYEESRSAGVEVNEQPGRPFGWVLTPVQPVSAPDGVAAEEDPWIRRYELIQVYDVAEGEDGWVWFDLGDDQWVKQTFLALVDVSPRPEGVGPADFWVEVDLYEQIFAAYEGDRLVYAGLTSTGLPNFETNEGLFTIYARNKEWLMYGGEVGTDYYYLQDVPYTMFFDDEIALHGAYWHDAFGAVRSHGCVNMLPRDSEWVWYWSENAPGDVWVWVHSSEQDTLLERYGDGLARYQNATAWQR
jgi:lipoprotein-anchoring transpeptidase ErfK/SrfK